LIVISGLAVVRKRRLEMPLRIRARIAQNCSGGVGEIKLDFQNVR